MSFNRDDCEYIKFNIENSTIEFVAAEDGVLISVPFADDTPQCIKDRLNDIIYEEMNKYQQTVECMPVPAIRKQLKNLEVMCLGTGQL